MFPAGDPVREAAQPAAPPSARGGGAEVPADVQAETELSGDVPQPGGHRRS